MSTRVITGKLEDLYNKGEKTKLSATFTGDTFLGKFFGKVELFINTNCWKYDKDTNDTLWPWGIMGLSNGKQSYNMTQDEDVVLVDLRVGCDLSGVRVRALEKLTYEEKGALEQYGL